ncbi:MAG: helix-turn-helix transcriptional regulator [Bacteroidota bacterium]
MNFNKIKEYCDQNGLSIPELAEKIGISKPGLYRSIQEETMKVETLEKIANTLKVPIWHFFDLDPETPYINDIEQQKSLNKINETSMAQMESIINDLKRKLDNIKTVTYMFIFGRELHVYGRITNPTYETLVNLLIDFLESNHDDNASEKFMNVIRSLVHTPDENDTIIVAKDSKPT